ncbi:MAG: site-specific integrase [Treponema sp.]|nr:site-specific integrase [Candidatus Treponema scatequi]
MKRMKMNVSCGKTFKDGYEDYILDMKSRNLRDGTLLHYEQSIKQIYKRVPPDTLISDMNEKTVPEFIIKLRDNPEINDVSLGTYARDLKTLLRFFMRSGYLRKFDIEIPKADKQPIETYTDDELRALLEKPNLKKCTFPEYRCWVIINLFLSSGIRQNSLLNIQIKDIDFDNSILYVNTTKNRKPLIIPMNEDMLKILKEYVEQRGGHADDWLFCTWFGTKLDKRSLYQAMYEYNHNRGVEKTGIHRFRHTFAKKWVLMGGSVVSLQKVLGHSSLNITENYLNMLTSDLKRDLDEINIIRSLKQEKIRMKRR